MILSWAGFSYIRYNQQEEMGLKALGIAQFLARSPSIVTFIQSGNEPGVQQKINHFTELIGATFIVIGDKDGIRLVHPVTARIGKKMKGGDNYRALVKGEAYVSFAEGSLGKSVRGKSAVFDSKGNIIGVVSVGYLLESLQERIEPFLIFLVSLALFVVAVNAILANYISKKFQRAILGFEPEEIGRLYVELDVTLSTIKEGVISIDKLGVIRSINKSACEILLIDKQTAINQPVNQVLPGSDLDMLLVTQESEHDIELYVNEQRIVANRNPIVVQGEVIGAVSSFRRKDEITELTKQLSQVREYADLLRSQTHEHRNKLNTISGLVQLGETETVQQLIGQESEHYQSIIEFLREAIDDPLIAGLLLGKIERARELGVELRIEEGSRLHQLPAHMIADDIVTILGNLIDNAFDSILNIPITLETERVVTVSLSDYGNEIILEVEDSGIGFPENIETVTLLERGVSTKANNNRGVGLYLISQLLDGYKGTFEMINNESHGARVTIYLPKERLND